MLLKGTTLIRVSCKYLYCKEAVTLLVPFLEVHIVLPSSTSMMFHAVCSHDSYYNTYNNLFLLECILHD